ncbi:MauE/DoxX family redox-associated membrane protein [Cryptosporangium japonicum]|uniref:Methylamine utilisation protein MauE domain-containing protein n=1 Tax=Cryptosporangium japonicum TaxID=80872 RepID=A0ABN0U6I7_9ACTN
MRIAVTGLLAALVVVFGVSAVGKARSRAALRGFTASLRGWRVVPAPLVGPVAVGVVGLEATIVVGALAALVVPGAAWRPLAVGTLGLAVLLLASLSVGIALALRRGPGATCACFGATERPLTPGHLVRDVVLAGVGATGLALAFGAGDTVEPAGVALAVFAGAVAGLLVARLDDLIDLFSPRSAGPGGRGTGAG